MTFNWNWLLYVGFFVGFLSLVVAFLLLANEEIRRPTPKPKPTETIADMEYRHAVERFKEFMKPTSYDLLEKFSSVVTLSYRLHRKGFKTRYIRLSADVAEHLFMLLRDSGFDVQYVHGRRNEPITRAEGIVGSHPINYGSFNSNLGE